MTHQSFEKYLDRQEEGFFLSHQINTLSEIIEIGLAEAKNHDGDTIHLRLNWENYPGLKEQINEGILRHLESYLEDCQRRFEAL